MIDSFELEQMMGDTWHPDLHPMCLRCGYDLTGSVSDRCPECGIGFSRAEVAREALLLKNKIRQLEVIGEIVSLGYKIAVAGALLSIPGIALSSYLGSGMYVAVHAIAIFCGFPSLFMGLSVVQLFRVPSWAREWLRKPVNFTHAYLAIFLGLTQLILAISM